MHRKLVVFLYIFLISQIFFPFTVKSNPEESPSAAVVGRYVLYEDSYWIVYNKTVEELGVEGFDVTDEYPSDMLLQVNYTRLDYFFKCKILSLYYPSVTLENYEGEHDFSVTAHRILEDGTIGEKIASWVSNRPVQTRIWDSQDPNLGVLFNPSTFTLGNRITIEGHILDYTVDRTELLDTPWGKNETYVLEGLSTDPTQQIKMTKWCDAQSGIILKQIVESKMEEYISREVMTTVETGIKIEVTSEAVSYEISIDTNSTINEVVFDPDAKKIDIDVEGSTGTLGIFNITIPKALVPPDHDLEVRLDGQRLDPVVDENENYYNIQVEYQHSIHKITINFVPSEQKKGIPGFPIESIILGIILGYLILSQRNASTSVLRTRTA